MFLAVQAASEAQEKLEADSPEGWGLMPEYCDRHANDPIQKAAGDRLWHWTNAEERAIPSASPAGFLALAWYACDLTLEDESHAVECASYAYRALAALAGRPVFGSELDEGTIEVITRGAYRMGRGSILLLSRPRTR